jgi:hypothetical protein
MFLMEFAKLMKKNVILRRPRSGRLEGCTALIPTRRCHRGRFFTSVSHFARSRVRSADEPYLAKS